EDLHRDRRGVGGRIVAGRDVDHLADVRDVDPDAGRVAHALVRAELRRSFCECRGRDERSQGCGRRSKSKSFHGGAPSSGPSNDFSSLSQQRSMWVKGASKRFFGLAAARRLPQKTAPPGGSAMTVRAACFAVARFVLFGSL